MALSLASAWAPGGRVSGKNPSHRVDDASTRSVESFASSRAYRAVVAAAATHRSATAHRRLPAYPSTTVRAIESAASASFAVECTQHSPVWKSVRCFLAHATELGVSVSSATAFAFSDAFSDAALAIAFFFVASLAILAMDVSTSTASTSSSTSSAASASVASAAAFIAAVMHIANELNSRVMKWSSASRCMARLAALKLKSCSANRVTRSSSAAFDGAGTNPGSSSTFSCTAVMIAFGDQREKDSTRRRAATAAGMIPCIMDADVATPSSTHTGKVSPASDSASSRSERTRLSNDSVSSTMTTTGLRGSKVTGRSGVSIDSAFMTPGRDVPSVAAAPITATVRSRSALAAGAAAASIDALDSSFSLPESASVRTAVFSSPLTSVVSSAFPPPPAALLVPAASPSAVTDWYQRRRCRTLRPDVR